jgi:FMN phosphatase YigB (HAD superfamily)
MPLLPEVGMSRYIVLFDLDGTLADITHRRHLVESEPKHWREFYAACPDDEVNPAVAAAFHAHRAAGSAVWIVSGRSDEVRKETERWLKLNGLEPDWMLMRKAKDHQPDHKLKRSWVDCAAIPIDKVLCVYDDRSSVVAMWRELGLVCFQVASGDF